MADITMCANAGCPLKPICYRQTATPGDWQSMAYFEYEVVRSGGILCGFFWPSGEAVGK